MSILKKRSAASTVLVVVVLLFTVIGMNRSVARAAAKTEKMFYEGVYLAGDDYTEKSIESQLNNRISAANGLLTLVSDLESLSAETVALRSAREELIRADTIGKKYDANKKLESAYKALASAMPIDIASTSAAKSYLSNLSGAQHVIERSAYNDEAKKTNDSLIGGVLYPLRFLIFTDFADYFS